MGPFQKNRLQAMMLLHRLDDQHLPHRTNRSDRVAVIFKLSRHITTRQSEVFNQLSPPSRCEPQSLSRQLARTTTESRRNEIYPP